MSAMPSRRNAVLHMVAFAMAMLLLAGCGGNGEPKTGARAEPERGSGFRRQVQRMLSVVVDDADTTGERSLRVVWKVAGRRKSVLCDELTDSILFPIRLDIVMTCLAKHDAAWAGEVTEGRPGERSFVQSDNMRRALAMARERLNDTIASEPELTTDSRALHGLANELFDEALEESGLLEEMKRAWEEHAVGHSPCYQEIWAEFDSQLEAQRAQAVSEGFCSGWESGLDVCTSDSDRVGDHVYLHPKELEPEQLDAAKRLIREGLDACLAKIIELDSPEVAHRVARLGRSQPSIDDRKLKRDVWRLWRTRGIEQLLDRTVASGGEVSDVDIRLLDDCIRGKLPSRIGSAEGGRTSGG